MDVRKIIFIREVITADEMGSACETITRVAAIAVLRNPFAGVDQTDLSHLSEVSAKLGETLTQDLVRMLSGPPVCYGKAALIGSSGVMEHGAAVLHPSLGKPVRAAIGGGKALMPSNHKVGPLGGCIDLPLGHKDEPWSFDHIDTMTLCVPDAPRTDEIVLCIGLSDGTRAHPRVGKGPSAS
ncbi:amino acid synthesis family protein [Ponticoccus sp. SC2-23]|nr:amino acid synthesis family protein [Ponticoccus sp. SC6-9]MBM1225844.1 amino acid synthesis family protein [Ponticoccus sp. SC6-15]MBM1227996.1 amino acid synthesis family protein [Ponticoccus sp. SC6-38]MBM1234366.1 amino acid synthesis family protein [Ponticoccus sp. SC6-45]MBM1238498.1 amino acid synthesis family protein [Ponticoccus sp. SC6-49]MBM1243767.1 amino acid synthesis family protein [Ponticoccus sp. SC2-64]MBM1247890.1 amino acid synthesis family protein [Ponticoccus sp. SC6-